MEYIIVFVYCCPWGRRDIGLGLEPNVLGGNASLVSTKGLRSGSNMERGRDILQFDLVQLNPEVGSCALKYEIVEVG